MKKSLSLMCAMTTIIGISAGNPLSGDIWGSVSYAASGQSSHTEQFKSEFAYDMAQITSRVISIPAIDVDTFKAEFSYATARVVSKVTPILPTSQRREFAYDMAQITTKIIDDPKLDVEKAKTQFAYEIAQLTTKVMTNNAPALSQPPRMATASDNTAMSARPARTSRTANNTAMSPRTARTETVNITEDTQRATLLRNNADIEQEPVIVASNDTKPKRQPTVNTGYVSPETYNQLIDELTYLDENGLKESRSNQSDKVNIGGEVRFHYAANSGSDRWNKDQSGIRVYFGADTAIDENWHAYGMLEGRKDISNYDNEIKLSHLFVRGRLNNDYIVTAGLFGYRMAEGNIYDSGFTGIRVDTVGNPRYTLSYGKTDYTSDTMVGTVRYSDFDYDLEAGAYNYKPEGSSEKNTILNLAGNYYFSNFSIGAMALYATRASRDGGHLGYVLGLNYSELKPWRPGTYTIFARYYDQPRYTYIDHGMNGRGGLMDGFTGFGFGINRAIAENVVAGIEYYDLKEKFSGDRGRTWWNQITRYF